MQSGVPVPQEATQMAQAPRFGRLDEDAHALARVNFVALLREAREADQEEMVVWKETVRTETRRELVELKRTSEKRLASLDESLTLAQHEIEDLKRQLSEAKKREDAVKKTTLTESFEVVEVEIKRLLEMGRKNPGSCCTGCSSWSARQCGQGGGDLRTIPGGNGGTPWICAACWPRGFDVLKRSAGSQW